MAIINSLGKKIGTLSNGIDKLFSVLSRNKELEMCFKSHKINLIHEDIKINFLVAKRFLFMPLVFRILQMVC